MALPVYVIHYEAPEWCRQTVRSLQRSDIPVAIVVVDNGGAPADLGVPVIRMPGNAGYTGAANRAIETSAGHPYLVVTSHDLEVETDTLRQLVSAADAHPRAGILGPDVGGTSKELVGRDDDTEWRYWTSGSCLLLRRACLDEVGGFDERFHSYGDDVDLGFRANDAGWLVGRVLTAHATHRGSAAGESQVRRLTRANHILHAYKRLGSAAALREVGILLSRAVRVTAALLLGRGPRKRNVQVLVDYLVALGIVVRRLPSFARPSPSGTRRGTSE